MKKVIFSLFGVLAAMQISLASEAKSGLIFEGQVSVSGTPEQVFDHDKNTAESLGATSTETRNGGAGLGIFMGYDYALDRHMTVGGKIGYRYLYEVNYMKLDNVGGTDDIYGKLNIDSFPVLATFKYYFSSGWLLGGEAGVDIQRWEVYGDDSTISESKTYHSNWNIAPMLGISGGYQWDNGLALTGSFSYVFGTSTDHLKYNGDDDNDALAIWSVGINLIYRLPM